MRTSYAIIIFALALFGAKELALKNSFTVTLQPAAEKPTVGQSKPEIKVTHLPTPQIVKGLYLTFYSFESKKKLNEVAGTAEQNKINSLVIDVKSDGSSLFDFNDYDIKATLAGLHEKGIYLIARVIAFKKSEMEWYDPASKERWQQLADISKKAIDLGFDEINFDYVRYGGPAEAQSQTPVEQRCPNIQAFFEFLNKEVRQKYGRPISADVFGITFINPEAGIGQRMEDAVRNFDYVMPMPYPSHWALGSFNISHPGNAPYQTVYQALTTGWAKVANDPSRIAQLRSWIQAFGIESITPWKLRTYTGQDIGDQIKACYDSSCVGWAMWNGFSTYPDSYFEFSAQEPTSTPKIYATSTASSTSSTSTSTH